MTISAAPLPLDQALGSMKSAPEHASLHVEHGDLETDVDVELAPIILSLWRAGIRTTGSCQGGWDDAGRGYIQFRGFGRGGSFP